ncbi:hypothetical protein [Wolbachia endosymbiont of Pentidionis agamae]|uniref:hypothetical protein n=1 Tax=Wolbachia endosymbiont of Pentidionis agamae TaxID=3110435 RepID=UPI002FD2C1DA
MPSFFTKYNSFEKRVNAAIDAGDPKLVQVLLGPKYCQLWQYWLVHGIIASKALKMERVTQAKLFLSIVDKQGEVLQEQKKLLEEQKKFLENRNKERENQVSGQVPNQAEQIKKSRNFIRDLLIATRDVAIKCRNAIVEESNLEIDCRKFYIPNNLLNVHGDDAKDLKHVIQQIKTISNAEKLTLTNEIDSVIEEMSKQINSDIWRNLSLTHHPDKQESKDDGVQKIINQTVRALRNIHEYVMKMGKVEDAKKAQLSDYIEGKECHFVYRMYGEIPLSILSSDQDVSEVVKISPVDGMSAFFELTFLAHQEKGYLMLARNEFLRDAVASAESIANKLQGVKEVPYKDLQN